MQYAFSIQRYKFENSGSIFIGMKYKVNSVAERASCCIYFLIEYHLREIYINKLLFTTFFRNSLIAGI